MYELHRIFCALPAEMQEERIEFYAAVGDFNESDGMRRGILFVPVAASSTLRAMAPGDVRENIRACRYYIEVLAPGAADPGSDSQLGYNFALKCCEDSSLPMREVVVLTKADFGDLTEFRSRVRAFLSRWLAAIGTKSATA